MSRIIRQNISNGVKAAALIIARGGSKRLPGKNNLDFAGKPVFAWNIVKAKKFFPKVYFSSDSSEMLAAAKKFGAITIKRPPELAADDVANIPVFLHAFEGMDNPDMLVSLQSNSPTVPEDLIARALAIMEDPGILELTTVDRKLKIHGSIWAIKRERLLNYGDPFIYKAEVFMLDDSVDIHTREDFEQALLQLKNMNP